MPVLPLQIRGVHARLLEVAKISGNKSNDKKRDAIKRLLVASREVEAGYIVRGLQGRLRIGMSEATARSSLPPTARPAAMCCACQHLSFPALARLLPMMAIC